MGPIAHTEIAMNSPMQAPGCREVHTQGLNKLLFSLGATVGQRTTRALVLSPNARSALTMMLDKTLEFTSSFKVEEVGRENSKTTYGNRFTWN